MLFGGFLKFHNEVQLTKFIVFVCLTHCCGISFDLICCKYIFSFLDDLYISVGSYGQEKELVERHNAWLNDELTAKVNTLIEIRSAHFELETEMSSKLSQVMNAQYFFFCEIIVRMALYC